MSDSAAPVSRMPDPPTPDAIRRMLESQVAPGVRRLIDLIVQEAEALNLPIYLVGGFVRDLVLKRPSLDLDFTVVGLAPDLAQALANHLGGEITIHPAFLTATWTPGGDLSESLDLPLVDGQPLTVDLVTARHETYAYPGALPTVEHGTLADDLFRRDFTINAMAIKLPDYEWVDQHGGWEDLHSSNGLHTGILRVLHARSFIDDPTRITRGVRFECRFGLKIATETQWLIDPSSLALDAVSGERWRVELIRIFVEPDPLICLLMLNAFRVLVRIVPGVAVSLSFGSQVMTAMRDLHSMLSHQRIFAFESVVLTEVMWLFLVWASTERVALIDRLKLPPDILTDVKAVERGLTFLAEESDPKSSAFVHAIEPIDLPACAVLWAIRLTQRPLVEQYVQKWRHVRPITTGDDLKARGLRPGPVFGTLLKQLRDAWLDGEVQTPEAEQALLERLIANLPATADDHQSTDQRSFNPSEKRR